MHYIDSGSSAKLTPPLHAGAGAVLNLLLGYEPTHAFTFPTVKQRRPPLLVSKPPTTRNTPNQIWPSGFYMGFRLACDLHKYVFPSLHVKAYTN